MNVNAHVETQVYGNVSAREGPRTRGPSRTGVSDSLRLNRNMRSRPWLAIGVPCRATALEDLPILAIVSA